MPIDILFSFSVPACHCNRGKRNKPEEAAAFLKLIAEPHRLHILCFLKQGKSCVCDIWKHLELPQNLVSHHLKALKDFGLIDSKKRGLKVFYSLNHRTVKKYGTLLSSFLSLS